MTQDPYWLEYLPEDAKQDALKDLQARSAQPASDPCKLPADREAMIEAAKFALDSNWQENGMMKAIAMVDAVLAMRPAEPAGEEPIVTPWDIAQAERHYPPSGWKREAIMDLAQFVAEVRHEARASALEENKAWSEAVATIMARCEALEDGAANELVKAESEHAQGYWRGQKRTAKSIRRELHDPTRALRNGEREG